MHILTCRFQIGVPGCDNSKLKVWKAMLEFGSFVVSQDYTEPLCLSLVCKFEMQTSMTGADLIFIPVPCARGSFHVPLSFFLRFSYNI